MTLDDAMALLPGLRRLRSIDAAMLRIILNRRRGECTWCGELVGGRRKQWCSDQCVKVFQQRCDPNTARRFVLERDGGKCSVCGRDTLEAEREAKTRGLSDYLPRLRGEENDQYAARKAARTIELLALGYARGRWREVDHAVPVVEGGGLCPVDQLRLLCGACHAEATKELAARLAL